MYWLSGLSAIAALTSSSPPPTVSQSVPITLTDRGGDKKYHAADAAKVTKGCDKGVAFRCTNLGEKLDRGRGVERDRMKAVQYFQTGCDGGHSRGCILLGNAYFVGSGAPKDPRAALRSFKRAQALGAPEHLKAENDSLVADLEAFINEWDARQKAARR